MADKKTKSGSALKSFCRKSLGHINSASNGKRILGDVADIIETDHWNNFDLFRKTARNLAAKYQRAGVQSGIYEMPTGGDIGSGRWIIQQCEDVKSATLDLLTPKRQRLADFKKCPWHVMQWTSSTPPEGLTGRIVDIENRQALENMKPKSLAGCFILIRRYDRAILPLAAQKGALGLIVDAFIPNNPDAKGWVKFGWGGIHMPNAAAHLPGMVISANQGDMLRQMLKNGQVPSVKMKISARHYSGYHDMTWGLIEGSGDPQQEIWSISHSAEPGAIDNASGVAVCLEAARIIAQLVAGKKLPSPKRSIRMLSGFECYSFFNYLENQRRFQTPLAGSCVDSVGAKKSVCKGRMEWHRSIPMSAGFADRLGREILQATFNKAGKPYKIIDAPFVSTLDTLIGDPKYGFPCPWMTTHHQTPGRGFDAYHSSADTIELLSEHGIAACAASLAAYSYYLADAGNAELLEMARKETDEAIQDMQSLRKNARGKVRENKPSPTLQCEYIRQKHHTTLQRLKRWCWGGDAGEVARLLSDMEAEVSKSTPATKKSDKTTRSPGIPKAALAVPNRKIPVTPTVENTPQWFADAVENKGLRNWALFWADGQRNIAEIADMASCEYGHKVDLADLIEFFEAHEKLGYVTMAHPKDFIKPAKLLADLRKLGVRNGMNLMVHSSLSALGHVIGGPDAVVDCLLKAVGRKGTVMVPTFNHTWAKIYNPATTPGLNGAIAETLRKRPDAIRSDHTTHPVAAIGARAGEFTDNHSESGLWTENSPLARLMAADGWVLCLGVDQIYSTHYHLAEVAKGHCIDPKGQYGKRVCSDGSVEQVKTLAYRGGECPSHPGEISKWLDRHNLRIRGRVANADCTLTRAIDIYEQRCSMLKRHCHKCSIMPKVNSRDS